MISTISLQQSANMTKTRQIVDLLTPWQNALQSFIRTFNRSTQQGTKNLKQAKTKSTDLDFTTTLNARQIKSVYNQAYLNYESYLALKTLTIRNIINKSSLNNTDKTILYRINSQQSWFIKNLELAWKIDATTGELSVPTNKDYKASGSLVYLPVAPELMKLSRHIFKYSNGQLPNLKNTRTMIMDGIIAQREENKNSKSFDYWLKITTLTKGKPIFIPIKANHYFENKVIKAKKFINTIQVKITDEMNVKVSFILEEYDAEKRKDNIVLGVDSNFNDSNLFSDSSGGLYGGSFVQWLKQMDNKIMKRQKYVQSNGLSLKKDDQYQRLNKRVRDYTKNEINRIVNKMINNEAASELVVESLDFRGGGLSKRMNRLLSRMGRSVLKAKLNRIGVSHGVKVLKVNPAYSSQECSKCGYVDKTNRNGLVFTCKCCKYKLHADVNSSRVLVKRRSFNGLDIYGGISKNNTRKLLQNLHSKDCMVYARLLNRVTGSDESQDDVCFVTQLN